MKTKIELKIPYELKNIFKIMFSANSNKIIGYINSNNVFKARIITKRISKENEQYHILKLKHVDLLKRALKSEFVM